MLANLLLSALTLGGSNQNLAAPTFEEAISARLATANTGRYLPTLDLLERCLAYNAGLTADQRDVLTQFTGYQYSFVGDTRRAVSLVDKSVKASPSPYPLASPFLGLIAEDALQSIVRAAHETRIVILNEAHHVPRSRWFATRLMLALRKIGFRYFAAETFAKPKILDAAWKKGYPSRAMGYYTCEPLFGDLVRQAMKAGYKGVSYEAEIFYSRRRVDGAAKVREIQEADNLVERVLAKDPSGKMFIYCGYSHAEEAWGRGDDGEEQGWMAARLKRLTGIDPLTIDQSWAVPHTEPKFALPEYQFAATVGHIKRPTVFRRKNGGWATFGEIKGKVDMQVFSPLERFIYERPTWMTESGYRKGVLVDSKLVPAGAGCFCRHLWRPSRPTQCPWTKCCSLLARRSLG